MYCSHCGKEIEDTDICPLCGCYARNAGQAPAAPAAAPVAAKPALKPSKTPVIVIAGISLLFTIIAEVCYALKVYDSVGRFTGEPLISTAVDVILPLLFFVFCFFLDRTPVLTVIPIALSFLSDAAFLLLNSARGVSGMFTVYLILIYTFRLVMIIFFARGVMSKEKSAALDLVMVIVSGVLIQILVWINNIHALRDIFSMSVFSSVNWVCIRIASILDLIALITCITFTVRNNRYISK